MGYLPYQLVVWDIWTIKARMLHAEVIPACGLSPTPCNNTLMSWRMPRGSAKWFQQTKMDVSKPPRWLRSVETKHCWVGGKTFQSENSWLFSFFLGGDEKLPSYVGIIKETIVRIPIKQPPRTWALLVPLLFQHQDDKEPQETIKNHHVILQKPAVTGRTLDVSRKCAG